MSRRVFGRKFAALERRGGRPRHISDRLDYLGKQAARGPVNQG